MKHPACHIFEQNPESMERWCITHGWPRFRAAQVLEWVYQKGIINPEDMTNLSKFDRRTLAESFTFLSGRVVRHQVATDQTHKLLLEWSDGTPARPITDPLEGTLSSSRPTAEPVVETAGSGRGGEDDPIEPPPALHPLAILGQGAEPLDPSRQTECVMIPADDRRTACVSSQVGCPVGCRFCASGVGGLDSNLSAGRIVEQVWRLGRPPGVGRISNVVFMGMGEPLANLSSVVPAIRTICSLWGLGISARKVTVSTVGLPQAIRRLARDLELPVTLALSLHAPNDQVRRSLIPWAEYTTIEELLAACREWFEKTGREITLEYTLLRGVNDRPEHAEELARIARTLRSNVNLIRYNEVAGMPFQRPRTDDVLGFQELLRGRNINAHIRASRGRDIAAACGQLRHESSPDRVRSS